MESETNAPSEQTTWFNNFGHLTLPEIEELKSSNINFREAFARQVELDTLLSNFTFDDALLESDLHTDDKPDTQKPKNIQKRNKSQQKNHILKTSLKATAVRSSVFSIFCNTHPFSNIDSIPSFKETFFNEKSPQQYERLDPLPKLLVCQFILSNQSDVALKSYPFTFRLPTRLHGCDGLILNKKIYRKLKAALGRRVLLWTTRENDGRRYDKTVTHVHGELAIHPSEYRKVKKAFLQIFGAKAKTATTNPIPDKAIIDLHTSARNSQTAMYGEFYSAMNWAAYSTKQELDRKRERFDCWIQKKPMPDSEKFYYISAKLNSAASKFYKERIQT